MANIPTRGLSVCRYSDRDFFLHTGGLKEGQDPAGRGKHAPANCRERDVVVTGWGWAHFDSVARANDILAKVRSMH